MNIEGCRGEYGSYPVEYHEHPGFNGQYHKAVWAKSWVSGGTETEAPEDAPITCAICGKARELR